MKCLNLEAGAVTWDEEPIADLIPEQFDLTDRRKITVQFWICGVCGFR